MDKTTYVLIFCEKSVLADISAIAEQCADLVSKINTDIEGTVYSNMNIGAFIHQLLTSMVFQMQMTFIVRNANTKEDVRHILSLSLHSLSSELLHLGPKSYRFGMTVST